MPMVLHKSVFIIGFALSTCANAEVVHTWVDAQGVTHFSDSPPAASSKTVRTIEFEEIADDSAAARESYYSVSQQWQRMRKERDAREQRATERRRVEQDRIAAATAARPFVEPAPVRQVVVRQGGYWGVPLASPYPFAAPSPNPGLTHPSLRPSWSAGKRGLARNGQHWNRNRTGIAGRRGSGFSLNASIR